MEENVKGYWSSLSRVGVGETLQARPSVLARREKRGEVVDQFKIMVRAELPPHGRI